jgi:hypothetical protein
MTVAARRASSRNAVSAGTPRRPRILDPGRVAWYLGLLGLVEWVLCLGFGARR